jgi:hypothetical protein
VLLNRLAWGDSFMARTARWWRVLSLSRTTKEPRQVVPACGEVDVPGGSEPVLLKRRAFEESLWESVG